MPSYLISTDASKMGDVQIDEGTGTLIKMTMYPVAPNPDNLPPKSPGGISTQWLVQHPTLPIVCALTSYWNKQASQITCFTVTGQDDLVSVTKTPVEGSTAGREACHATFSPLQEGSNNVTLAVAHYNDGVISFFTLTTTEIPTNLMDQPAMIIELPEVVPGTKRTLPYGKGSGLSIPSSHFVQYAASGDYLWVVDPNQSVIFTYKVNPSTGLPSQDDPPVFTFQCHTDAPALGWVSSLLTKVMGLGCRPRRVASSPNGQYVFISYETRNVIQVYHLNAKTGQIDPDSKGCIQEVSTLDPSLVKEPLIGLSLQATAEMMVYHNCLYVSNRGSTLLLGRGENSVRVFDIRDGGRLASPHAVVCAGPVRHFCITREGGVERLVAGTSKPAQCLQTFQRPIPDDDNDGKMLEPFKLVGTSDVGVNVFCVLPTTKSDKLPDPGTAVTAGDGDAEGPSEPANSDA